MAVVFLIPAVIAVFGAAWPTSVSATTPQSVGLPELPGTKTGKSTAGAKNPSHGRFLKVMVWTNR